MGSAGVPSRRADRARAWHRAIHAEFCDVFEPWAHGTVVRATAYPDYWDLNVVRVEEDPRMSAEQLAAFADEALDGLGHRRVDFEDAHAAQPLRERFEALGWKTERLVWMRHESPPRPQPDVAVQEIPYDRANHLRVTWHREDFDDDGPPDFIAQAREAAERRGVQVLAAHEAGVPIGYSQLEHHDGSAEIAQVYVHPDHRGRGLGTALTCAAIHAAGNASDLWIVADDEGRPKQLYTRLGFRPAWTAIQTLRLL
jgi:ribosomal protein S18 acetylase RimI-like enzyme